MDLPEVRPASLYGRHTISPGLYRCLACWPEGTPQARLMLLGLGLLPRHLERVHGLEPDAVERILAALA